LSAVKIVSCVQIAIRADRREKPESWLFFQPPS
jgi:hypothetical protein